MLSDCFAPGSPRHRPTPSNISPPIQFNTPHISGNKVDSDRGKEMKNREGKQQAISDTSGRKQQSTTLALTSSLVMMANISEVNSNVTLSTKTSALSAINRPNLALYWCVTLLSVRCQGREGGTNSREHCISSAPILDQVGSEFWRWHKQMDLASAYVLHHLILLGPVFQSSMELELQKVGIRQVGEQRSSVFQTRVGWGQRSLLHSV